MLCLRKIPAAKNSLDKKRDYQDLPSEIFRFTVPKIFVGENFCAVLRKVSGSEELYVVERRGTKIFCQIIFVSQCRKLSKLNHFVLCFRKLPVSKKILDKSGVSSFSVRKLLSYRDETFRR